MFCASLSLCGALEGCNAGTPSGADALSQVAELARSGRLDQAKDLVAHLPPYTQIRFLDPDGPEYCTKEAFQARIDGAGYEAARKLLSFSAGNVQPVYRYAMANQSFQQAMKDQDDTSSSLCERAGVQGQLDYTEARTPLAAAMKTEIDALRRDAVAQVGEARLEAASQVILAAADDAQRKSFQATCKATRAEHPDPISTSPALTRARDLILTTCENAGF